MVVHFGGLVADMTPILDLANRRGIAIVEDAAHALPASRGGKPAGSFGEAGALSFYATKTVTTGEGGMLVTNDPRIADRARVMRLHGISRDAWKRYTAAGSWFYEIEDVGFKYNLTDIAAAIGIVQLGRAEQMRLERERVALRYGSAIEGANLLELIDLPATADRLDVHSWHLYPIRLRVERLAIDRAAVIEYLKAEGIGTSVHFIPLHLHPYYRRTYEYEPSDLPAATREYEREISLPIYPGLGDDDVDRVVEVLSDVFGSRRLSSGQ
jgi:dTDP-4-amino-4,6-dideoxygalactose transaminase